MPHKESKPGYLSVTEVLSLTIEKSFLKFWYGKNGTAECERIKRESQELGIKVHDSIEKRFHEMDESIVDVLHDSNVERMVGMTWDKFVIPWEAKPLVLEETYEDVELKLQGTLDAIIDTNRGTYIVDFKTSNQLDKISVPLQLAAYAKLCNEGIWKGLAVRIDKEKNKVEIKEWDDLTPYWEIFSKALILARYIKFGIEGKDEV